MTLHPDPHDLRALAALWPLRVVPGRPRKPAPDPGAPVTQLDTRHTLDVPAADPATVEAEHRARLAVCHHHTGDPAGALEVLQMLGLVDEHGRPVTIGRVGQLSDGIRD